MNPPEFSVLLLAWDDADPAVLVLGGSALPPTLPLVYQLAAQHPVLAVYPHLPAAEATAALERSASAGAAGAAAVPAPAGPGLGVVPHPLTAGANGPGVHLLPLAEPAALAPAAPTSSSRLVGLDDLRPATQGALPTSHSLSPAPAAPPRAGAQPVAFAPAAPNRSQWPTSSGPGRAGGWQAPAAPYVGAEWPANIILASAYATARESFPPPPPAPLRPLAATAAAPAAGTAVETSAAPAVSATLPATLPATPTATAAIAAVDLRSETVVPAFFNELVEEIGAAEAYDLDAPEDDLVPDLPPPAAAASAAPKAAPEPVAVWAVRQPPLAGLNFRMIQYARRAAQLVDGRRDFGVIYAPAWPAWLAALEIRNRSERPLVLYVPALASDTAPTAERGWLLGLERMVLRRATLVLVPDAEVLRLLRARYAEVPGEIRIVPATDEAAVQQVLAEMARG